jgi:hypothetical protein
MAIAEASTATTAASRSAVHGHVGASPNRHRLADHFPSLSFTIHTGGLPYFDLLLTTDASLFDAANAGRRTASNFYASHQDGGLAAAKDGRASYLVPSAVIRGFAAAVPKPAAIYFTVIAYQDRDGTGPVFAVAPEDLVAHAPSISLAPDFKGQTLARIMAVPSERLRVVAGNGHGAADFKNSDAADDASAGDGAYGLTPPPIVSPPPANGDYVLHRVTLSSDAGPRPLEPTLPSPRRASAAAQGAEFRQAEAPAYLGDDGGDGGDASDGEAYQSVAGGPPATGTGARLVERDSGNEAESLAYRSLDEGPGTKAAVATAPGHALDLDAKRKIIRRIALGESGGESYWAINDDGEFKGKFAGHPAKGKYHIGLSFGLIQFTQDSSLGELLVGMQKRDPKAFRDTFGDQSDELIRVTTAAGPPSRETSSGRSARVQPVGGADLWEQPWVSRFIKAGHYPPFQEVQEQLAISRYLDPVLQFATWLGLDTERALAMVVDRSVQMGLEGAKRWIIETIGPVSTPTLLQPALTALGHTNVHSFQAATPGLQADGVLGPMTHAAMAAALRKLGSASPVPVMTREQMLDALVRRSTHDPWRARVEELRKDAALSDSPFQP